MALNYTEQDLKTRNVGKAGVNDRLDPGFNVKYSLYTELGLTSAYRALRSSIEIISKDHTGHTHNDLASRLATIIMDTYLIQKSRGVEVEIPSPIVFQRMIVPDKPAEDLVSLEEFELSDNRSIDPMADMAWVYHNLEIKNPDRKTAPSTGAWSLLKFVKASEENKKDFFMKMYTKVIPTKSQQEGAGKFDDDSRTIFTLLDRLQQEVNDGKGKISVL
jgi:hypothetical protein